MAESSAITDAVNKSRTTFVSLAEAIGITDILAGGKLILIPFRGTVVILEQLRNTPAILSVTRGTRQILDILRGTVSI